MSRLLVICGPTATGKTDLAIKLAKKFSARGGPAFGWNGEIVSADSRQVYKGMDVGTGKEISKIKNQKSKTQIKNQKFFVYRIEDVPLWLWDVAIPDYQFSVADYVKCADLVIDNILERKKLPILVGGTGLYIKAVVDKIDTIGIPPDWELRKRLLNCSIVELLNLLRRLDSKRAEQMNDSDRNNPRRLIRAIEVALWKSEMRGRKIDKDMRSEKKEISHFPRQYPVSHLQRPISVLFIGLTAPYKYLYRRIDQRVNERVKQGAENEIKKLFKAGYSFNNSVLGTTIGYREWQSFFENKATISEVVQKWKFAEHGYVRRQMTWFRKDKRINWFDISKNGWEEKLEELISKWLIG